MQSARATDPPHQLQPACGFLGLLTRGQPWVIPTCGCMLFRKRREKKTHINSPLWRTPQRNHHWLTQNPKWLCRFSLSLNWHWRVYFPALFLVRMPSYTHIHKDRVLKSLTIDVQLHLICPEHGATWGNQHCQVVVASGEVESINTDFPHCNYTMPLRIETPCFS